MSCRTTRPLGKFIPDVLETLLLRSALLPPDEAITSWDEWRRNVVLEKAEEGSYRLYPLVYRNLSSRGREFRELGRLKGAYRHTWYRNQLLLHRARPVLALLANRGMTPLVLKGLSLILRVYRDLGLRVMNDVDILVPRSHTLRACDLLLKEGCTLRRACTTPIDERLFQRINGVSVVLPGGLEIDLHSYLFHEQYVRGIDDSEWGASVGLVDWEAKALHPADELLLAIQHGAAWNVVSPIRWAADSWLLIRQFGNDAFWARFEERSRARLLTLQSVLALGYLSSALDAPVPAEVLRRLSRCTQPWFVRTRVMFVLHDHPRNSLMGRWAGHLCRESLRQADRRPSGFLCFFRALRDETGARTIGLIPSHLLWRIRRKTATAARRLFPAALPVRYQSNRHLEGSTPPGCSHHG
jgi:hypothetical protein